MGISIGGLCFFKNGHNQVQNKLIKPKNEVNHYQFKNPPLFVFEGKSYNVLDLPESIIDQYFLFAARTYKKQMKLVADYVVLKELAKKRGVTPQTDNSFQEIQKLLDFQSLPEEEVKKEYRQYLAEKKKGRNQSQRPSSDLTSYREFKINFTYRKIIEQTDSYIDDRFGEMIQMKKVQYLPLNPEALRISYKLNVKDIPFKGNPNAKASLVLFSNFINGGQKNIEASIQKLLKKYPNKLNFYQIDVNFDDNNEVEEFLLRGGNCFFSKGHDEYFKYRNWVTQNAERFLTIKGKSEEILDKVLFHLKEGFPYYNSLGNCMQNIHNLKDLKSLSRRSYRGGIKYLPALFLNGVQILNIEEEVPLHLDKIPS